MMSTKDIKRWLGQSLPQKPGQGNGNYPKISVITPCFNSGAYLEETIRSVLMQGYPNLEYMIVDGGSTDNSVEIIKKYEHSIACWVSEADQGQSQAINKGFGSATGDIIAWLNADDIYLPGALFQVADTFMRYKVEWIVGITLVTDNNLKISHRFIPCVNSGSWRKKDYIPMKWLDFVMTHRSGTALPQPSSFWSKKAISTSGGIDETFHYAMDHDLYGRMARSGYRPRLIPQSLACFRTHKEQKTSEFPIIFWKEELRSAKRWQRLGLTPGEKQALDEYVTWFAKLIQRERLIVNLGLRKYIKFALGRVHKARKLAGRLLRRYRQVASSQKEVISKKIIAQYISKDPVIIEAGAHIGVDTEQFAWRFPKGKIFAFEPVPNLFLRLSENMQPYKNVDCIPSALSNEVGEFEMYVSGGVSDGSSSLLPPKDHLIDHPDTTFDESINVTCITLDKWAQTNNIEKVDLLWLDLQGYELDVLKAGLTVLENVQAIYTEVNLKELYVGAPLYAELREWLEERNFKVELEDIPWEDGGNVLFVRNPPPKKNK